jgi:PAT family beta-lactamase induction signal transducer AmpG
MNGQSESRRRGALGALAVYLERRSLVMLALGFASGLPNLLIFDTLSAWLRESGLSLSVIGFFALATISYSLKFVWAPLIDRTKIPILTKYLGHRRSWMLVTQGVVIFGLWSISGLNPATSLMQVAAFAVLVGFFGATQDIVIDAWRIEAADTSDEQGLLTSGYQLGYRIALLVTDALVIAAAARVGWPMSYVGMAILMSVGVIATLFAFEPKRADAVLHEKPPLWTPRGFVDAVVGPFVEFFQRHKAVGVLMLAAVALYRLPDFIMGPMYNPYYHDLGMTKDAVALVRGTFGLVATFSGIALGGLCAIRFGVFRTLMLGVMLEGFGTAGFALLGLNVDFAAFATIMALDSFAQAFAGVALVAYMSSLTSLGYTATQYALLSSTYALLGKFLKGFSGAAVEGLQAIHGVIGGYQIAWVATGLTAIPPMLLFLWLGRIHARQEKLAPTPA